MSYRHDIANPHVIEKMQKKLDENSEQEDFFSSEIYHFFMTGYIVSSEMTIPHKKHLTDYSPLS
jgi:hypothetical protein